MAIGANAGDNMSGSSTIAIGPTAGGSAADADMMIAIGEQAGYTQQGAENIHIGGYTGYEQKGTRNINLGNQSGMKTEGDDNFFVGSEAGYQAQGSGNIMIGKRAGTRWDDEEEDVAADITPVQGSNNIFLGESSGMSTHGDNNIAVGPYAGRATQGSNQVAVGDHAGTAVQGEFNTSLGASAGPGMVGDYNIALGAESGDRLVGSHNVVGGYRAGRLGNGSSNTLLGMYAGEAVVGSYNAALGSHAFNEGKGEANTAVGHMSMYKSRAARSVGIGSDAGYMMENLIREGTSDPGYTYTALDGSAQANAIGNVAVGYKAGRLVKGEGNTFIGDGAGVGNQTASAIRSRQKEVNYAVAIGANATTVGNEMIAIGRETGVGSDKNAKSVFIGSGAGVNSHGNDNDTRNVYIGEQAGKEVTGALNTMTGVESGMNSTGNRNAFYGYQAGQSNSGGNNVAVGHRTLVANMGYSNVAVGEQAGLNTLSSNMVAIGNGAGVMMDNLKNTGSLQALDGGSMLTAVGNIAIGDKAGRLAKGQGNVFLGSEAGVGQQDASSKTEQKEVNNAIVVGIKAKSTSDDTIVLGRESGIADDAENSIAIGSKNTITNAQVVALGNGITTTAANSVFLGSGSAYVADDVDRTKGTANDYTSMGNGEHNYTFAGGNQVVGVVSVGSGIATRRIQNVAPGFIGVHSTDAINGSQLYAVMNTPVRISSGGKVADSGYTKGSAVTPNEGSFTVNDLAFDFGDGLLAKAVKDGNKNVIFVGLDKETLATDDRFKGPKGEDGVDGRDGLPGRDGIDGKDGAPGRDGIDGKDGAPGRDGIDGKDGAPGRNGIDGKDGEPGRDGIDGKDGAPGRDGIDGKDGRDGKNGFGGSTFISGDGTSITKVGSDIYKVSDVNPDGTVKSGVVKLNPQSLGDKPSQALTDINGSTNTPVKLTNVENGDKTENSTDAVNGRQLYAVEQKVDANTERIGQVEQQVGNNTQAINDLRKESRKGDAMNAALSALKPIAYNPAEPTQIMAGVGTYRGEQAVAVGAAHYVNGRTMLNGGIAYAGNSHVMANLGVTWRIGSGEVPKATSEFEDEVKELRAMVAELRERLAAIEKGK